MDPMTMLRFAAALIFVLALIGVIAWIARRVGPSAGGRGAKRRLGVVEALQLDPKRRLVLVRRDQTEHLILLSPGGDRVVERVIASAPAPTSTATVEPAATIEPPPDPGPHAPTFTGFRDAFQDADDREGSP